MAKHNATSAKSSVKKPEWIKTSERLPVGEGLVLVCTTKGRCIFIAGLLPEKKWIFVDIDSGGATRPLRSVSHWMPLPEPPAITRDALHKQWDAMHCK